MLCCVNGEGLYHIYLNGGNSIYYIGAQMQLIGDNYIQGELDLFPGFAVKGAMSVFPDREL